MGWAPKKHEHCTFAEVRNGDNRIIALQCRVCLRTVAFGNCRQCGKRWTKLPYGENGRAYCTQDCADKARLEGDREKRRALRERKKTLATRCPGLPGVKL